jgi:hypothetical protein
MLANGILIGEKKKILQPDAIHVLVAERKKATLAEEHRQ